jgi:hypothetical protein
MLCVARLETVIAPEGLVIRTELADMSPAPLILPAPAVLRFTVFPLRAPPTTIGLPAELLIKASVAPAPTVIEPVVLMPPELESVRLNPPVPAVEAPLTVRAALSVKLTLPAELVV